MALVELRVRLGGLRGWLDRPSSTSRRGARPSRRLPVPLAWALAGGASAAAGLLVVETLVLTFWAADARSATGAGGALRVGGSFWLLGYGVPLNVREGHVGIMPLGLTALLLLGAGRAGAGVARSATVGRDTSPAWVRGAGVGLPYGLVALLLSRLLAGDGVHSSAFLAFALPGVLSGTAAAIGASRVARAEARAAGMPPRPSRLVGACPVRVWQVAPAAAAAACALLAAGALIAATFVSLHLGAVADVSSSLSSGVVAGAGMFLAGALLAPNIALWATSACIGAGFSVGTGTTVSPLHVDIGDVPAFPVLAALPGNGPVPITITITLFAVPVAAGAVAGRLLLRRANPPSSLPRVGTDGLLAGLGAGLLVLVATALSGGGTGPARLAITGPPSWQAGGLAAGEVAFVATAVALTGTKLRRRSAGAPADLPAAGTLAASGSSPERMRRLPEPVSVAGPEDAPDRLDRQDTMGPARVDGAASLDDGGIADEMEARAQPARRPRFGRRYDAAGGAGRMLQSRLRRRRRRSRG
ncbi:MAG: cell division protein PerM [Frankiaceae bacterium]